MMSKESTVSTTPGLIDVAPVCQYFETSNEQNDNDVLSQAERTEFLSYPRFFSIKLQVPFEKIKKQLVFLWAYRKGRQNNDSGIADMVSVDSGATLNVMKDIRESLRRFIMDEFLADMRQVAKRLEMQIQSNAEVPVPPSDFKKILQWFINNPRIKRWFMMSSTSSTETGSG